MYICEGKRQTSVYSRLSPPARPQGKRDHSPYKRKRLSKLTHLKNSKKKEENKNLRLQLQTNRDQVLIRGRWTPTEEGTQDLFVITSSCWTTLEHSGPSDLRSINGSYDSPDPSRNRVNGREYLRTKGGRGFLPFNHTTPTFPSAPSPTRNLNPRPERKP